MTIEQCNLKFSGHQTFPVRYGWIYKIVQELKSGNSISHKENIEQQMISMGVGKNMVQSIRHWAFMLGITERPKKQDVLSHLAKLLFIGDNNSVPFDEFMDRIGTIWLLHWTANSKVNELSSSRWFFNYFNGTRFDKATLSRALKLDLENHPKKITDATLNKDIDCFLQTYSIKYSVSKKLNEDSFTSPFTELGLLVQQEGKQFVSELSKQPTLPLEVFTFALIEYLQKKQIDSNERTVSFEKLLTDIGSPGRIFRLSSSGLSEKLDGVEKLTEGKLGWTDTQGLRQVQHSFDNIADIDPATYLKFYYQDNVQ